MAWESRRRGAATGYFYRSVRVGEVVKKVYLGRGAEAQEAAQLLEQHQRDRDEARCLLHEARFPVDEAGQLAIEVGEWASRFFILQLHFDRAENRSGTAAESLRLWS